MSARVAPVTGPRVWVGAALVAVAVLGGARSLSELLAPGPWTTVCLVLVVGLAVMTAALRQRLRARVAPTAWAVVAAVLALVALYGGRSTGLSLPVPTLDTARRLDRLTQSGVSAVAEGHIPLEPTRGVELLIVLGVVTVFLLTDLIALALGRAGLAGVPLLALWAAVALFDRMPALWVVVVTGTAYLLLLNLTRPVTTGRQWWRDMVPGVAVGAGITVVAVALGPIVGAVPGYGSLALPGGWGPQGITGPLRLSTDLDMRESLGARSDRPLLRYTTTERTPGPMRMFTMTTFDGREWQRTPGAEDLTPTSGLLWPEADPEIDEPTEEMAVQVGDLDQDRLPIPLEPREVIGTAGGWSYDAALDEVLTRGSSSRDLSYVVRISPRELSDDLLLEDTSSGTVPQGDPSLAVPATPYTQQTQAIVDEVTQGLTTDYERAVAIQSYLRDARNFTYDTEVPPARTDDAVYDFLTDRTGYCVQFATTMAVMTRMAGLPTRLAVGFLPGVAGDVRGEYVITGQQSHAWPEVYFEGAGWVRFEPTPAIQTGAPPVYADPNAGLPVALPSEVPTPTAAAPVRTAAPAPPTTAETGRGGLSIAGQDVAWPVVAGAGGLVVLVLGLLVWRWTARRRSPGLVRATRPELAWARLRERLTELGVTWTDATTPRQAGALVTDRYGDDDVARAALGKLVRAVETERYTPPRPLEWDPDELEALVDEAVRPFEPVPAEAEPARG